MKVLQINTVYGIGSTGKIAKEIHDVCVGEGISCFSGYRCGKGVRNLCEDAVAISDRLDSRVHGFLARHTLWKGAFSIIHTMNFLVKVDRYAPDVIHLHNLHGSYINIPLLFNYIKKKDIPVIWTLHDCWPFTAICAYFTVAGCDKWLSGCGHCPQLRACSSARLDTTHSVWKWKKRHFLKPQSMCMVTPSQWLADLVKKSFLGQYPAKVIQNGIDLSVFKPTQSEIRRKYGIPDGKFLLLGVAFDWGYRKGLDAFIELAARLDPQTYQIVLVGTNDEIDRQLPPGIIAIHRTQNQQELAAIYSVADLFVNPTREDNFPTVNMESLACGTPVVTFRTGGSPESLDSSCGAVVDGKNASELQRAIEQIYGQRPFSREACVKRAAAFDKNKKYQEYIQLYREISTQGSRGMP